MVDSEQLVDWLDETSSVEGAHAEQTRAERSAKRKMF